MFYYGGYKKCPRCQQVYPIIESHSCPQKRKPQNFHELEVELFIKEWYSWLETKTGKFEVFYAERQRNGYLRRS